MHNFCRLNVLGAKPQGNIYSKLQHDRGAQHGADLCVGECNFKGWSQVIMRNV